MCKCHDEQKMAKLKQFIVIMSVNVSNTIGHLFCFVYSILFLL